MELPARMKETGEFLDLIISLGNASGKSMEDKKFGYRDFSNFIGTMTKVMPAIEGSTKILGELSGISEDDKRLLCQYFKEKFDIPQDDIEKRIEDALVLGLALLTYVETWM